MRVLAALILLIAGFIVTGPASLAVWLDREIFDRQSFLEMSQEIMRQPEVQDRIAQRTAENIVEEYDLPASRTFFIKELVEPGVPLIVDTEVTVRAINQLYDSFIEIAHSNEPVRDDERLVLDLSFIGQEALEPLLPLIGREGVDLILGEPELVVIAEGRDVIEMYRLTGTLERLALPLVFLAGALFLLAVLVSPSRLATLGVAGVLVALAGLVLYLVAGDAAWNLHVDRVAIEPAAVDAARQGYDVQAESFRAQQVLLMAGGAAVAGASFFLGLLSRAVRDE